MYADYDFYKNEYGGELAEEDAVKALNEASMHIDVLTYSRICATGFENLTEHQKMVIKITCCRMADFEKHNADVINSLLSSYSLNGASMSFTGKAANVSIVNGIVVQNTTYEYLKTSALCVRRMI